MGEPSDHKQHQPHGTTAERIAEVALRVAIEQRSLDPIGVELGVRSSVADFYVIGSGTSQRHVQGICDNIRESLSQLGETSNSENGYENAEWVIMDYGNVVVHVFYEPTRQFYRLEELLKDYPRMSLPAELEEQARKLRTGMVA